MKEITNHKGEAMKGPISEKRYNQMVDFLNNGGTIIFSNYMTATEIKRKHIPFFTFSNGFIEIHKTDYSYCKIRGYK